MIALSRSYFQFVTGLLISVGLCSGRLWSDDAVIPLENWGGSLDSEMWGQHVDGAPTPAPWITSKGFLPPWESVSSFSDGRAHVELNGQQGFIDENGRQVGKMWNFASPSYINGYATVSSTPNSWGIVDQNGKLVITEQKFDFGRLIGRYSMGEFAGGYFTLPKSLKFGYFNAQGIQTVPFQWDIGKNFSEGLAGVNSGAEWGIDSDAGFVREPSGEVPDGMKPPLEAKGGKWGFINADGKLVINPTYDDVDDFSEGLAGVEVGDKWGYINTHGDLVITPAPWQQVFKFHNGLALVINDNKKYGYIDKTGALVIPCQFDDASNFINGVAEVGSPDSEGLINTKGQFVLPYGYFKVPVSQKLPIVPLEKDGKHGFALWTGQIVVPPQWDQLGSGGNFFSEGFAPVAQIDANGTESWGFINMAGKIIGQVKWDNMSGFRGGLACVCKDKKWGYIDTTGTVAIPLQWTMCSQFHNGYAWVEKTKGDNSAQFAIIDKKGAIVSSWFDQNW